MKIGIDDRVYEVNIIYKNNKNMYLRIKDDLSIIVTCPKHMPFNKIEKFVMDNIDYIVKVIRKRVKIVDLKKDKFLYLGMYYDICYTNKRTIEFNDDIAFIGKDVNIYNWYRKKANVIFQDMYDKCYSVFKTRRDKPLLKIRKMKGKWGVCNITSNTITINLELIKYDLKYLEYVIFHELSHLNHMDHSNKFWECVSKYVPDYKNIKNEMKGI